MKLYDITDEIVVDCVHTSETSSRRYNGSHILARCTKMWLYVKVVVFTAPNLSHGFRQPESANETI